MKFGRAKIFGKIATMTDSGWACQDKTVEKILETFRMIPIGYHPQPALAEFYAGVKAFKGEIILVEAVRPEDGDVFEAQAPADETPLPAQKEQRRRKWGQR